jgi:hypothetical protein
VSFLIQGPLKTDQILSTAFIFSQPIERTVVAFHLGLIGWPVRADEIMFDAQARQVQA